MRWFVAFVFLMGAAFAQSQPTPSEQRNERGAADQAQRSVVQPARNFSSPATSVIVANPIEVKCADTGPESCGKKNYFLRFFDFTLTDTLVALFTAILGIFTINLAGSTKAAADAATKAADAARDSADAAVAAESARLLIYPKSHSLYEAVTKFGILWDKSPEMGILSSRPSVEFVLKNYGKSPATLISLDIFLEGRDEPPPALDKPGSLVELPVETVIGGSLSTPDLLAAVENFFTMKDAIDIAQGKKSVWLYGTISYSDVFDRICDQQFLFRLHPTNGGFIRYYDRSTYRKPQHRRLEAEPGSYRLG